MIKCIFNKELLLIISILSLIFLLFYSFFLKSTEAQVCLPLDGYLVWPGTWESGWIPMASTTQYVLTKSPIYVSGSNVGIGTLSPVYTFQVNGDISGTRLCIGSDCRSNWPGGGITGSGSPGQLTFWIDSTSIGGDNNLFWDNTNKRLGISTTTPQTSLHVIGNITANTFLGTISAANVSSGQFGANTGGGNYSFPGNVGIGTTSPSYRLDIVGDVRWSGTLQGGSVPWARLTSFPSGCPSGQFVTAVGTTLTCASPPSGGGVTGSGYTGYLPLWTSGSSIGTSIAYQTGSRIQIGGDFGVSGHWYWQPWTNIYLIPTANNQNWSIDFINQSYYSGSAFEIWTDGGSGGSGTVLIARGDTRRVGIGWADPQERLHVAGTIRQAVISCSTLSANSVGNIVCSSSDERLKNIYGYYNKGLEVVLNINPIKFSFKDSDLIKIGFSAQNLRKVIPEAAPLRPEGYFGLDSEAIIAALVNAIKDLKRDNDDLKNKIESLKMEIEILKTNK
jgi:hypothetical protein